MAPAAAELFVMPRLAPVPMGRDVLSLRAWDAVFSRRSHAVMAIDADVGIPVYVPDDPQV